MKFIAGIILGWFLVFGAYAYTQAPQKMASKSESEAFFGKILETEKPKPVRLISNGYGACALRAQMGWHECDGEL
jgi:hypothetical protein